jgi:DNA-binding response OmpR family regulator
MDVSTATILVLEDNPSTLIFLADNLTADGYEILECDSVRDADKLLRTAFPDLAIIDLGLPDGDGLDLIQRVRKADRAAGHIDPDLPMLVLSGRASELDRLRGFDRGCDDYLVKPFSYQELRARVEALLRRTRLRPKLGRLRVGSLEIDPLSRQVWVRGKPVSLSKKEFALLRALASEPTRVFTREELLRGVWGFRAMGVTRTLDSHAHRLRKKVNAGGDRYIVNVWGVGYRLVDGRLD